MHRFVLAAALAALAASSVSASSLRTASKASEPDTSVTPAMWSTSVGEVGPKFRSMPSCHRVFSVPGHRAVAVRVDKEVRCFWLVICGEEYGFRVYDRRARQIHPDGTCDGGDVVGEFSVKYDPAPVEPAQGTVNNVHFPFPLILTIWSKTSGPEQMEVAFNSPQQRVMFLEQLTPERLLIAMLPAMRALMPACASVERLSRVSFDTGREFVRQWLLAAFRGLAVHAPPRQFCAPTGATYPDGQPKIMCDNGWEAPIDLRTILHYTAWHSEPTTIDRDLKACAQALQVPEYVRGIDDLQTVDMLNFEGTGLDFFGPFMSGNFKQAERTARRFVNVENSGYTWDIMMILSVFEAIAIKDCHSASDHEVFSFSIADPRIKRALEEASKKPHDTAVIFPFPIDAFGGNVRTGAECPPAVVYNGQPGFDGPGGPGQPIVATATGGVTTHVAEDEPDAAQGKSDEMLEDEAAEAEAEAEGGAEAEGEEAEAAEGEEEEAAAGEAAEGEEEERFRAKGGRKAPRKASAGARASHSELGQRVMAAMTPAGKGSPQGRDASLLQEAASRARVVPSAGYGSTVDGAVAAFPHGIAGGPYAQGDRGFAFRASAGAAASPPSTVKLVEPRSGTPIHVDSKGYAAVPPLACVNIVKVVPGRRSVCAMRSEGAQPAGTSRGDAETVPRGEFRVAPFTMFAVLDNRFAGVAPGPEAVPGTGPLRVYLLAEIEQPPPNVLNVLRMSDSGEPSLFYYPQPQMAPRLG